MKRTYQPNARKRAKKHGFLGRKRRNGVKAAMRVIRARRRKGRHKVASV